MWTDKQLETMGMETPIQKAMFLSDCTRHRLVNSDFDGWVVTEENLEKFAELIVQYCKEGKL